MSNCQIRRFPIAYGFAPLTQPPPVNPTPPPAPPERSSVSWHPCVFRVHKKPQKSLYPAIPMPALTVRAMSPVLRSCRMNLDTDNPVCLLSG